MRRLPISIFTVLTGVACIGAACRSREAVGVAYTLQDSCEDLVATQTPSAVELRPGDSGSIRWTFRPGDPLRRIHGVSWDPTLGRLAILDRGAGQVTQYDLRGDAVQRFLRLGRGPGEWSPDEYMTNQRPQLLGAARDGWLIPGVQGLSLYDADGRWRSTIPVAGRSRWRLEHAMTARLDAGHIAMSRAGTPLPRPSSRRRGVMESRLVSYDVRTGDSTLIGVIGNPVMYSGVDPETGEPRQVGRMNPPFYDAFRRTWGVQDGWLAFVSYASVGICTVRLSDRSMRSYRLATEPPVIDDAEKDWGLRLGVRDPDRKLPGLATSLRDLFERQWPARGPYYFDLVVDEDGGVQALRRTPDHRFAIDRYAADTGYVGSRIVIGPYAMPRAMGGGIEIVLREDDQGWIAEGRSRDPR